MANTQLYVLDRHLHPVPPGVPGELYIGGAGVARGYRHRSDWTAERFLSDPFGGRAGARLYKTGDRVRWRSEGRLEFLGRLDQQIKLRGFRIELGEIEAVLRQYPAIKDVAVVARQERPGHQRLVAYVVLSPDGAPTDGEFRRFLQEQVQDYMVPAAFVRLDTLPLTPNGKVDRRALPAPDASRPALEEGGVAPRSAVEELLAGIWAQLLGLEQVGRHDNFFALGGDSILSIQMIAQAALGGLRLTPRHIFHHQTIAELAAVAERAPALSAPADPVTDPVSPTPASAVGGHIVTDFPLAQLGQAQLAQAFDEITFAGEDV
jgi:hypothetical protein